jgi:rubrerythrin
MSYTYPIGMPQGQAQLFTNRIREILIAEIYAINGYQMHIANSNMTDINTAWHSIMGYEKKHYGLLLTLLRKYDPEQYRQYLERKVIPPSPKSPIQVYKPEYDRQIILNNLRSDIKGEFEAVILYEEEMPQLPYLDIRMTLQTIISEEKGHAEHLTQLLLEYDPDRYNGLD